MSRNKPKGWKGSWPPNHEGRRYRAAKVERDVQKLDEQWIEEELREYEAEEKDES